MTGQGAGAAGSGRLPQRAPARQAAGLLPQPARTHAAPWQASRLLPLALSPLCAPPLSNTHTHTFVLSHPAELNKEALAAKSNGTYTVPERLIPVEPM